MCGGFMSEVGGKFPPFKEEPRIQSANGLWHQRFHLEQLIEAGKLAVIKNSDLFHHCIIKK